MTSEQRAAQLWSLLALAARNQQILSYSMVASLTGIPRQAVGPRLGPIQDYCVANDLPPLTSIVVSEKDGVPSEGFTGAKIEDLFRAQARVFVFDWLSHKVPFPTTKGKAIATSEEEFDG